MMRCEESVANKQVESVTIQLSDALECAGTLPSAFFIKGRGFNSAKFGDA